MTRRSTERFVVAVVASALGVIAALFLGRPETALLTAPWVVLLILGATAQRRPLIEAVVSVAAERAMVGDPIALSATVQVEGATVVEVTNHRAVGFQAGDEQEPTTRAETVPRQGALTMDWTVACNDWGTHQLGRLTVSAYAAFGLFRWSRRFEQTKAIRLHPNPQQLQELLTPHLVRRLAGAHLAATKDRGVEYADVRQFSAGDSVRDINWRASARSPDLWVSQRHPDRASDVVLLVDSFIESGHDVRTVFGLAIEAAIALADSHLSVTDRVGLVQLGGVIRWVSPGSGRLALQRLSDALLSTRLYATAAERDLAAVPPRALPPRSFVVAISPLLDARFEAALFGLRAAGHDVAVIECVIPLESGSSTDDILRITRRLWEAERMMVRDQLAEAGIAIGRWHSGEQLDPTLLALRRRRQRIRRVRR